jgi:glycerol uptake facilitator-like aquaporin
VSTDTRALGQGAALAIGGTVALASLVGGPVSGASLNPARSIGPAAVAGDPGNLPIYLIGPVIGAMLGAGLYHYLRGDLSRRGSDLGR